MEVDVISVGEAARRAGLSPKAVRLYEALGIVTAVARTPSGYRMYTPDQVELLRFVGRARGLGLSLKEIAHLVQVGRREGPPCGSVMQVLERHMHDTQARLTQLAQVRETLSGLLDQARAIRMQGQRVRLCRLIAE